MDSPIRRIAASLISLLLSVAIAVPASAELVTEKVRSFRVIYGDGTSEDVLVKYQGHVDLNQERGGKASKPLEGHPFDTRYCRWSVSTYVVRQPYFVSKSGQQAPIGPLTKTYDQIKNDRRGPKDIIQAAGGYHRTCGDVQDKITSDVAATRASIVDGFDEIVQKDAEQVERDLESLLKPIRVERT